MIRPPATTLKQSNNFNPKAGLRFGNVRLPAWPQRHGVEPISAVSAGRVGTSLIP